MPNHVTNIVSLKGNQEDVKKLFEAVSSEIEDSEIQGIDFNKIIPMPESLKITSGSQTDNSLAVVKFLDNNDSSGLKKLLSYPWAKAKGLTTPTEMAEYLMNEHKVSLEDGRKALENIKNFGHVDWYSWSIEFWGTKWNAYSHESKEDGFIFDTAWSTPEPIIQKLSEMFPNVEITLEYADEDFGYNCGIIKFHNGCEISKFLPEGGSAEAYRLASKVKNYNELDLMDYIVDSESDNFINDMLDIVLEKTDMSDVIDFVQGIDHVSENFLNALKEKALEREDYEAMPLIESLINNYI